MDDTALRPAEEHSDCVRANIYVPEPNYTSPVREVGEQKPPKTSGQSAVILRFAESF